MAEIRRYPFVRHLRGEPNAHVLRYRRGKVVASGRGVAFWFRPMTAGIAEIPTDDRELQLVFHGRSADFQDVTVQGFVTYRIADPQTVAQRVDFSIDLVTGVHLKQPLEKLSLLLTGLAQQFAHDYLVETPIRDILGGGYEPIRQRIAEGLGSDPGLGEMGLEIVAVRVSSIKPSADLEKALEAPVREKIQQDADEAAFERRAMAVENERAIQENELKNQIELARREESLIAQRGQNARRNAEEQAEAGRIEATGKAARTRIEAEAEAEVTRLAGAAEGEALRQVETARAEAEKQRMEAYAGLPSATLWGLAARELASKLEKIEHLNLSPDLLGPALTDLFKAGARRLETGGSDG